MTQRVRCQTRPGADALDEELAARLNRRLAATEDPGDSARSLRPVLRELLWWFVGAFVMGAAALHWLV